MVEGCVVGCVRCGVCVMWSVCDGSVCEGSVCDGSVCGGSVCGGGIVGGVCDGRVWRGSGRATWSGGLMQVVSGP